MKKRAEEQSASAISIYIGIPFEGVPKLFFLENIIDREKRIEPNLWNMFQGASGEASFDFMRIVSHPQNADFLLLPHSYFSLLKIQGDSADEYISHFIEHAEKYGKKILIFSMDDSDEHINIPHSFVFRYSQYGYKKRANEIITPPYPLHARSPKLHEWRREIFKNLALRNKSGRPLVSFCGWAGFPNVYRHLAHEARVLIADMRTYFLGDPYAHVHKSGIYWRRKAMRSLKKSAGIQTNFLIRKSYSAQKGHDGARHISPEDAEKEYIESIIHSDFVLSPKGHGNASVRFYEALSLGRFPVLVNTDCVLPLEDVVDYGSCVINISHDKLREMEKAITDFYNSLSDEELAGRQKMARALFELLRPGSFLKIVLSELKQGK